MKNKPPKNHPWRNSPISPSRRKLGLADADDVLFNSSIQCKTDRENKRLKKFPRKK